MIVRLLALTKAVSTKQAKKDRNQGSPFGPGPAAHPCFAAFGHLGKFPFVPGSPPWRQ